MKIRKKYLLLFVVLITALTFHKPASAQGEYVSFQVFYDELSPYGEWVDYQNYGYVWIPDVDQDFVPYSTAGYWVLTDYGWTWMSDYEWGWAPFHYGRWDYDNYYGWLWVPDTEWGPSWVNWRRADGYYGWSPMEPGISISLSFGRQYDRDNDHWLFVRDVDFERHDLNRYSVDRSNHGAIIRNSTIINSTYIDNSRHTTYVTGPARADVQRVTGRSIYPVSIKENRQPGQVMNNGQLQMYRPNVQRPKGNQRQPSPLKVGNLRNVKRPSERNLIKQPGNSRRQINGEQPILQDNSVPDPKRVRPQPEMEKQLNKRSNSQPVRQPVRVNPPGNNGRQQPDAVQSPQSTNERSQNKNEQPKDSRYEKDKK
jgi:hypothetical protein